jgi:hypothetical protein
LVCRLKESEHATPDKGGGSRKQVVRAKRELCRRRQRIDQEQYHHQCEAGLKASAPATEWIGIHALSGVFLFGVVIPHDSRLARGLTERPEDLVVVPLLPAFFAFSGMRTQIPLVSGAEQ